MPRRRLTDCCWACGIAITDAHSALGDARATTTLLASYLDPRFGQPPLREHMQLPWAARQITWPPVPYASVPVVLRQPAAPRPTPASAGRLAGLLDDLPLANAAEEGAPPRSGPYLELLAEVLEDGILTEQEAQSLAELARLYQLSRTELHQAHRGFLLALAHKVIEDGKVTRAEREELLATATALGFTDGIIKTVLNEARDAYAAELGNSCRPLPDRWPHGRPLRIGDGVAFTGCDDIERARLEGRAVAAGARVTGSVSRRTVVLVTDGADPTTTKAVAARQYGTRVVRPAVFADLIHYIQAAQTAPATAGQSTPTDPAQPITPPATGQPAPSHIRAWARQQGLQVGIRGRIPADVVTAYHAAHRQG